MSSVDSAPFRRFVAARLAIYGHLLALLACCCMTPSTAQPGFLSLSCGGSANFTGPPGISWVPDSGYVTSGNTTTVTFLDGSSSASQVPLRFFPNLLPARNCYRLPVPNATLVLVRPYFYYKDYDGNGSPPIFQVSLGTAIVATVNLTRSDPRSEEYIWPVTKDTLSFCLLSVPGGGFPVISSLEVRPLPSGAYASVFHDYENWSLRKQFRINCGYTDGSLRYPNDYYDRVWDVDQNFSPSHLSAGFNNQLPLNISGLKESPPLNVLQTGRVLARKSILSYNFPLDKVGDYYVVLYFAGILPVLSLFDILINGNIVTSNYTLKQAQANSIFLLAKNINNLNITLRNVSFYPQINAIEIYEVVEIPLECSSTTVSALQVIQQSTGFDLGWQDDPCSPTPWQYVGCEGSLVTSLVLGDMELRTISPTFSDLLDLKILDLHNTSLTGKIMNLGSLRQLETLNLSFNKLTSFGSDFIAMVGLQILDLQNNSLEGPVPESLGGLKNLRLLNLENNKLQGTLPWSLKREDLQIRVKGNLCLSFSPSSCHQSAKHPSIETPQVVFNIKKQHGHGHKAVIIGAIGGICLALILVTLVVFLYKRRQKADDVTYKTRREMQRWNATNVLTYKEIKVATNNFRDVIGSGGFGSVYLGKLSDGKLVAVKVRFDKTQLGTDSFINEVHLLSQVHHQNLVALEGFCYESNQQILVYEYLPGGSLAENLYGSNSKKIHLNWARRLKIAVDAAKGLDYLHNGSDPRIIHRDVKCSNILLDLQMNAKVSDFGLSKEILQADVTHVTTAVKGTAGYLDPEYYATRQLTEKSDVYSFGVVLLELICGREPLSHAGCPDSYNLVLWAKPYLQAGAFEIVDECLKGNFNEESMRRTASIAVRSAERDASQRPTMAEVLAELKEAYSIQLNFLTSQGHMS